MKLRNCLLSLLGAVLPFVPLTLAAQNQTVEGTILLPAATVSGAARREYVTSGGLINGVHGYVIVLDPASVGTGFSLQPAASNTGTGNLDIYFYSDLDNGVVCSQATTPSSTENGVVCGTHAIVVIFDGANVTFHYQAGLPAPPEPPFVASQFS